MLPPPRIPLGRRLAVAFDLFAAGVAMKRAQLAATYPRASAARLDQMVKRWLVDRPLPDNGLVQPRRLPLGLALSRAADQLEALGVPFALVGGLAVGARTTPRFTADVDFIVACDDAAAETLSRDFVAAGYEIDTILENRRTKRIATIRFRDGRSTLLVDLLFSFTGIEPAIARAATIIPIGNGISTRVATIGHLVAMKLLADRPQDRADLDHLLGAATTTERRRARVAVSAIQRAGFGPRRDLTAELREQIADRARRERPSELRSRRRGRKGT